MIAAAGNPFMRLAAIAERPPCSRAEAADRYYGLLIELDPEADESGLENFGIKVMSRRGDILTAYVPESALDYVDGLPGVARVEMQPAMEPRLDLARPFTGVDRVYAGTASLPGYDGTGVVVGLSDIGFDPAHVAFAGRLRGLAHFTDSTATAVRMESPAEIASWTTDDPDQTHATHVAGILAAGAAADPWRGVAPGADIFATTSTLDDCGVLNGVETIIDYARRQGRPAVINLSLGQSIGPRDGSTLFCRYLDMCAEEAVIVLSAGNDGARPMHLRCQGSTSTCLGGPYADSYMHLASFVDCWSDDERPVTVAVRVHDREGRELTRTPVFDLSEGYFDLDMAAEGGVGSYFEGRVSAAAEVCPANGRYNLLISYDLTSRKADDDGISRYYVVLDFEGAGADISAASRGGFYAWRSLPGVVGGDSELSISDMACGFNTISVGSLSTRRKGYYMDGGEYDWTASVGPDLTVRTSSHGVTPDGRALPQVSAPGSVIISAMSDPYLAHSDLRRAQIAGLRGGCAFTPMGGTSMASPHAAGIFALWLQADPTLTPAEIREIAVQTADTARDGCVDAEAGLRRVLQGAGLSGVDAETAAPAVWREGSRICIRRHDGRIEVYDLTGRMTEIRQLQR